MRSSSVYLSYPLPLSWSTFHIPSTVPPTLRTAECEYQAINDLNMGSKIFTGACNCGKIKYKVELPESEPLPKLIICHCTHCKRYTASAFSTNIVVPEEYHSFTSGQPKIYIDGNDFGTELQRRFCGDCGSPLTSKPHKLPGKTVVKFGTLDDRTPFTEIEAEIYVKRKETWLGDVLNGDGEKFEAMHVK